MITRVSTRLLIVFYQLAGFSFRRL